MGQTDPEDRRLVARCLAGEPAAWRALVAAHAPALSERVCRVYARLALRKAEPDEVAEVVQETFVHLADKRGVALARFDWRCGLAAYLGAIAARRALDRIRSDARARRRWGGERVDFSAVEGETEEEGIDPADAALLSERSQALRRSLAALSDRERIAVEMCFWGGLSPPAIARAIGVSDVYARKILKEALATLRHRLQS